MQVSGEQHDMLQGTKEDAACDTVIEASVHGQETIATSSSSRTGVCQLHQLSHLLDVCWLPPLGSYWWLLQANTSSQAAACPARQYPHTVRINH